MCFNPHASFSRSEALVTSVDMTEEKWNPNDWLLRLKEALEVAGNGYLRMPMEEAGAEAGSHWPARRANRTTFAMLAIGAVNNALLELPGMVGHVGLAPIHELIAALLDLGNGGQPALLGPTRGVGKGTESSSQRIVRQYAVAFVGLLERIGTKPTSGSVEVANMLAKAGHRGLKGELLSAGTVKGWWNKTRQRDYSRRDPNGAAAYQRFFGYVEQHPDWPFSPAAARAFVENIIASPAMRSKVGHPPTSST
jgi:hypothetical protein